MVGLSKEECTSWCSARGLVVNSETRIDFSDSRSTLSYVFERMPVARVVALTCQLVWSEQASVNKWMLWITDRGTWNDVTEEVGTSLVTTLRNGHRLSTTLEDQPGVIVDDLTGARVMALAAAVIGWDAYAIPDHAKYFVFFHHHGVASIVSNSRKIVESCQSEVGAFEGFIYDAHPIDGPPHAPPTSS